MHNCDVSIIIVSVASLRGNHAASLWCCVSFYCIIDSQWLEEGGVSPAGGGSDQPGISKINTQ